MLGQNKVYPVELRPGEYAQIMRQRAGLTQADLAAKAGVSRSVIAMVERETATPRMSAWVMGFIDVNHNTAIAEGQAPHQEVNPC